MPQYERPSFPRLEPLLRFFFFEVGVVFFPCNLQNLRSKAQTAEEEEVREMRKKGGGELKHKRGREESGEGKREEGEGGERKRE